MDLTQFKHEHNKLWELRSLAENSRTICSATRPFGGKMTNVRRSLRQKVLNNRDLPYLQARRLVDADRDSHAA